MDCKNCGAPMKVVPGKDYFVCDYCSSLGFPDESLDGVRVLDEVSEVACPICENLLVSASVEDVRVLHCDHCHGLLIAQASFAALMEFLRLRRPEPVTPPQPLDAKELERQIHCPYCHQVMDTHPYYGPGNIVVDNCNGCAVLWLDYGELHRITNGLWYDQLLRA